MVVGEFTQETDLLIIGGGPGGYSCAFRAAELGIQTLIVDSHPSNALGGVCLHDGCIPSKTLLHIAEIINTANQAQEMGIRFSKMHVDAAAVREWKNSAVRKLAAGLDSTAKKLRVERLNGVAHFEDSRHVAIVGGAVPRVRFRRAVIATGSSPIAHDLVPFEPTVVWTPQEAVQLSEVPKSLLVIGNNYSAVELACIYAAMGSDVTLVDESPRMLPAADTDLVRPLDRRLDDRLKAIAMGVAIKSAKVEKSGVKVVFAGEGAPGATKFDRVIVAIGNRANIHDLGLNHTGVQLADDGFVHVNERLQTADQRIYAVGDATGSPLLADKAIHQGRVCGEILAGWGSVYDPRTVPMTVFTDPQLAWCGLTEEQAAREGISHAAAKVPWGASGRAVGMGRSEGVTKIIFDPDTRLVLGVGMCGPHACEMIAEGALAIEMGAVLDDLAATIHPHPTVSELLSDAAHRNVKSS